ncbi:MAG: DUF885 family protein, partial [Asticcacaulis sp.]
MLNRRILLTGASALTALVATSGCTAKPKPEVKAIFQNIYDEMVSQSPMLATTLGLDKDKLAGLKSKLDPSTPEERARILAFYEKSLAALKTIDRNDLTGMDRINYDAVLWDISLTTEGYKTYKFGDGGTYWGPYPISQLTGAYQYVPDFLDSQHSIETKADAEAFLSRLGEYAVVLDQ